MLAWRKTGMNYGYPECCVADFESRVKNIGKGPLCPPLQAKAGNKTGFVPCPMHALLVLEGVVELKDLIKNRKHPVPFPYAGKVKYDPAAGGKAKSLATK